MFSEPVTIGVQSDQQNLAQLWNLTSVDSNKVKQLLENQLLVLEDFTDSITHSRMFSSFDVISVVCESI